MVGRFPFVIYVEGQLMHILSIIRRSINSVRTARSLVISLRFVRRPPERHKGPPTLVMVPDGVFSPVPTAGEHAKPENARGVVSQSVHNSNNIIVKIAYNSVRTLLDTGSGSTIMSERLARELRLPLNALQKSDCRRLLAASGTPLYVVGSCDLDINFSGFIIPHNVLVVRNLQENLIMGSAFLSKNNVIIDYCLKTDSIADDLVRLPLHEIMRVNCMYTM